MDNDAKIIAEILPAETVQQILDLSMDPVIQQEIDDLAEKANQGTLTPEEREKYQKYVDELDLIAIFKLKARAALSHQSP